MSYLHPHPADGPDPCCDQCGVVFATTRSVLGRECETTTTLQSTPYCKACCSAGHAQFECDDCTEASQSRHHLRRTA